MAPGFLCLPLGILRASRMSLQRMLHPYTIYLPTGNPGDYFTQWTALLVTDLVAIWFQQGDRFNFLKFIGILEKGADWG